VNLNVNGVRDTEANYAAAKTLGSFAVKIAAPTSGSTTSLSQVSDGSTVPALDLREVESDGAATVVWSNFDPVNKTITMKFSKDVSAGLNASDLRLKDEKTLKLITNGDLKMTYDKQTNTATWTIVGDLPAANYKVMLSGVNVYDASGQKLDGNGDGKAGDDYVTHISAAEIAGAQSLIDLSYSA
jgi:hypothetical protein